MPANPAFPEPHPKPLRELRVITFAGGFNLPVWVAQRQGYFAAEGLDIRLDFTPGSTYQLTHLIAGTWPIGLTAFDNVVAYRAGQNEAYVPPGTDVDLVAVMGSDNSFLSLSAQGSIARIEDLAGKTLTVDALTTGYAFVLREMLARRGIAESDVRFERAGGVNDRFRAMTENPAHAATMQGTPFELMGEARGFRTLARASDVIGPYQGVVAAVKRSWAAENAGAVVGFIRAYQRAIDWIYEAQNRAVAEAILVANAAGMTPALAAQSYPIYTHPKTGFFRKVSFDMDGVETVLALRRKYGRPPHPLADPEDYLDRRYLQAAEIA